MRAASSGERQHMSDRITAQVAVPGARGFDCNTPVTRADASRFLEHGYTFAIRYVGRVTAHSYDLTPNEASTITTAGLGCMIVQHVQRDGPPWWTPTDDKGKQYGASAAEQAHTCGYPQGATIWLDLEGIAPRTDPEQIISYANLWHEAVAAADYLPGVYIGYGARLSAQQLYDRLHFTRYWAAFNLNADEYPAVRGVCMRQQRAHAPAGVPFEIDADVVQADNLGGLPVLAALEQPLPG
jgi:hypothetical protein